MEDRQDRLVGMLVGLAVGDALGMPLEFRERGTFQPVGGLESGGPFDLPAGYWTDDTSMALCLADSIIAVGGYDSRDVMDRYRAWYRDGDRSSTGTCFDIGGQTREAIECYEREPVVTVDRRRGPAAGNGGIMRLAPIVIASVATGNPPKETARLARISARETHFSRLAEVATAVFGRMLHNAAQVGAKDDVLDLDAEGEPFGRDVVRVVRGAPDLRRDEVPTSGYVLDTLAAAAWAFSTTDTFEEGALRAVNLGGDSDTIGAVFGQLAGAYYGHRAIPPAWRSGLYLHDDIAALARTLAGLPAFGVRGTRFREDRFGGPGDVVQGIGMG